MLYLKRSFNSASLGFFLTQSRFFVIKDFSKKKKKKYENIVLNVYQFLFQFYTKVFHIKFIS